MRAGQKMRGKTMRRLMNKGENNDMMLEGEQQQQQGRDIIQDLDGQSTPEHCLGHALDLTDG
jgi:hypothetical protein